MSKEQEKKDKSPIKLTHKQQVYARLIKKSKEKKSKNERQT